MKYRGPYKKFSPSATSAPSPDSEDPAIDNGYFCSHVGVGVSATSAGRSAQQYLCVAIVIGYSRSDPAINIGEFGSYSQGIRRLRMGLPRLTFADEVHLAQPPRIEGQGIRHISRPTLYDGDMLIGL